MHLFSNIAKLLIKVLEARTLGEEVSALIVKII